MKPTVYKEITLQQLRSFCATARHGSLTAAAAALALAQPTVWKQVHALEQTFGTPLVEAHARGCRLTEAGEIFRRLVEPPVASLDLNELQSRFDAALGRTKIPITVAGSPRRLAEDLLPCIAAFLPRWPRACFTLREVNGDEVPDLVDAGEAALGFTIHIEKRDQYPLLSFDPWYQLDIILVTPRDHPLARKRRVRPEDLKPYPLLGDRNTLRGTPAQETLLGLGLFETESRRVEAHHAGVLLRGVEMGLGIALAFGLWPQEPHPTLHQRPMHRYFGRPVVYLVRRAGVHQHPAVSAFAEEVRSLLARRRRGARRLPHDSGNGSRPREKERR